MRDALIYIVLVAATVATVSAGLWLVEAVISAASQAIAAALVVGFGIA